MSLYQPFDLSPDRVDIYSGMDPYTYLYSFINSKETEMAQAPTYEDGYRKGVEDATKTALFNEIVEANGIIDRFLSARREKLLTKKVTKWVTVIDYGPTGLCALNPLLNTKKEAEEKGRFHPDTYLGAYPVEIEIPL